MKYKYDRLKIVNIVANSKKTKDGHYWCPYIGDLLMIEGSTDDSEYVYKRELFGLNMYFTENDIKLMLCKEKNKLIDTDEYYRRQERFFRSNVCLYKLDIDDLVYGKSFKVGELVDAFEFFNNN